MTADLLAHLADGTLAEELARAPRATPVVARTPLERSPSEAVRRHAATFATRPRPTGPAPVPVQPAPEVAATPVTEADLELAARLLPDPPGPVRTAVRNAKTGRWAWTVHYGCGRALGRPEVASESLVVRAALTGAFPWVHRRVVAVWRRTGGAGSWSFDVAFRWTVSGERVTEEPTHLAAGELAWWLKTGASATANPRPPKRRESKAVAAARARGELDDARPA